MKSVQIVEIKADIDHQVYRDGRGLLRRHIGGAIGRAEVRAQGSLAGVMWLMCTLTPLRQAEFEFCDVTLTVEGDGDVVREFAYRAQRAAYPQRFLGAIADGIVDGQESG